MVGPFMSQPNVKLALCCKGYLSAFIFPEWNELENIIKAIDISLTFQVRRWSNIDSRAKILQTFFTKKT